MASSLVRHHPTIDAAVGKAADPRPDIATVVDFIHCINRGDVDGMDALIADQHTLQMFTQRPRVGRHETVDAWREYLRAHPDFTIHVDAYSVHDDIAVIGRVTGSHLVEADEAEELVPIIWLAQVECRRIRSWRLLT